MKMSKDIALLLLIVLTLVSCEKKRIEEGQSNWTKYPFEEINWENNKDKSNLLQKFRYNQVYDIQFLNEKVGFMTGALTYYEPFATFYYTVDGGRSWRRDTHLGCSGMGSHGLGLLFFDENNGFVSTYCGGQNTVQLQKQGDTYAINGGVNMPLLTYNQGYSYIIDENSAVFSGAITHDAGLTWSDIDTNNCADIFFWSETTGIGVNNSGEIFKSVDGGSSWLQIYHDPLNSFEAVHMLDSNRIVVMGTTILHSVNGGQTWTESSNDFSGTFYDMDFLDENIGFAAGSYPVIRSGLLLFV
jgi:photosystem II stability/assembly factor-like uncharacterized protein